MFGGRGKGRRDRPSGTWRDRLHDRAHPASLYLARPGLARRLRLREPLGGGARQDGRRAWRRRIVAAGSVTVECPMNIGSERANSFTSPIWRGRSASTDAIRVRERTSVAARFRLSLSKTHLHSGRV